MTDRTLPNGSVTIEVPFHDVDSYGIVWHGHYLKYLEVSRCALLDKFSYNYNEMMESGFGWPVIESNLRYIKPALFGQILNVSSHVIEYENRLKIGYVITDAGTGKRLTRAYTVQVAVDLRTNEMLFASPRALLDRLGV